MNIGADINNEVVVPKADDAQRGKSNDNLTSLLSTSEPVYVSTSYNTSFAFPI